MGVPLDFDEAKELDALTLQNSETNLKSPSTLMARSGLFRWKFTRLLPKTRPAVGEALDQWGKGVSGRLDGKEAWYRLDERIAALQTDIVGCLPQKQA